MKKLFIALFVLLLVAGAGLYWYINKSYKTGQALYEASSYESANAVFEDLTGYKKSSDYLRTGRYELAMNYYNEGRYLQAEEIFRELGTYKNSRSLMNSCKYARASELLLNGSHMAATRLFRELGDFSDSAEKYNTAATLWLIDEFENNDEIFEISVKGHEFIVALSEDYPTKEKLEDYKSSGKILVGSWWRLLRGTLITTLETDFGSDWVQLTVVDSEGEELGRYVRKDGEVITSFDVWK